MSPKRLRFVILCLISLPAALCAQDKPKGRFGKITPADFSLPNSPIIDSNTNAVILTDAGTTHFVGNKKGWFSYVFKKQIRIKIINKRAFELAKVNVHLFVNGDDVEKMDNLSGSTYNLEDGKVVETKLNKTEVYDQQLDKNRFEKLFTLPGVKEGSIIEYTYTITSDFFINIPSWEFQSPDYPCLWSDYEVNVPQLLSYITLRQGVHEYFIDKGETGYDSYNVVQKRDNGSMVQTEDNLRISANTIKHHWVMKDIPAFHVENYISSPRNYIDKIEFQLSKTNSGEGARDVEEYMNTWAKATDQLLKREDFGKPLEDDNDWLDKLVNGIVINSSSLSDRAKAIYYYVAGHFTCTDHYNFRITTSLKDVLQKHNGTVGDINMLLVAMLRKAYIPADPVLLSTREYGFNVPQYPVMDRLNYVVVRATVDGQVYYLDAARRQLGFGQLAEDCYNGHARIISAKDSGSVYFSADSLKDKKMTMVVIINSVDSGIEGSYQSTLDYPGSYELREEINRAGKAGFFKNIQTGYGEDAQISHTGIDSLDKPEMPVKVYYDFRLNQAAGADLYYFSPIFGDIVRTNPFTALERKYPVEMSHTTDYTYILNMEVPEGYDVEELPKSAKVVLNGEEGLFEYLISNDGHSIQLRARLKLNRANFSPDDYSSLRDFYGFIVKKESEQIVLKKKK
jgi:hypothetical protein